MSMTLIISMWTGVTTKRFVSIMCLDNKTLYEISIMSEFDQILENERNYSTPKFQIFGCNNKRILYMHEVRKSKARITKQYNKRTLDTFILHVSFVNFISHAYYLAKQTSYM